MCFQTVFLTLRIFWGNFIKIIWHYAIFHDDVNKRNESNGIVVNVQIIRIFVKLKIVKTFLIIYT